jgi:hypothetical protein
MGDGTELGFDSLRRWRFIDSNPRSYPDTFRLPICHAVAFCNPDADAFCNSDADAVRNADANANANAGSCANANANCSDGSRLPFQQLSSRCCGRDQ